MPKDPTNSSGIFASNLLNSLGNARTLNGLTSDQFMRTDVSAAPLEDNEVELGTETHRYKDIWTLSLNGNKIDIFCRRNKSNLPTLNDTFNLGDGTHRWKQIFAAEINAENVVVNELRSSDNSIFSHSKLSDIGTNTHAQIDAHIDSTTLVHGSTSDNVAGRIVARDSSGNFSAGTIKAQLGDLAEKYTATVPSEVGTVYSVSSDTTAEVEVCLEKDSVKVVGVVSDTAGFVLSSEQKGITLGIKGKVKVRVIGPVKKGDLLASAGKGQAYVTTDPHFKFAVALEDNSNVTEKLVLAVL